MKRKIRRLRAVFILLIATGLNLDVKSQNTSDAMPSADRTEIERKLAPYFQPPAEYHGQLGDFRSPLQFYDGRQVKNASDWPTRREEIKSTWHEMMGSWPQIITDQQFTYLDSVQKDGYTQYRVSFRWLPQQKTEGYLLIPSTGGQKPAVITVFYEPETAIGQGKAGRDFALALVKKGFVTLSIGTSATTANKTYSLYYPSIDNAKVQPLSLLAYAAANALEVLAKLPQVNEHKIGIMGHSYGGKWAMFASCLYEKFACAVWSDPGIVFDETKGAAVNYWEPWYLGYYPPPWKEAWRKKGLVRGAQGLYPSLIAQHFDLHELHALMAPRPFLVSGGSSDPIQRWKALNHSIQVNSLLGYENRVAMTNRPEHSPNEESNSQAYLFFEYFLK